MNVLGHGPAVLTAEVASSFPLMPLSKCQQQMTGTWHGRGTQCQSPLFPILPPYFFILIPRSFRIIHPNPRRACFFLSLESGENILKDHLRREAQKPGVVTWGSKSSAREIESGASGVQGQPQLPTEFEVRLAYKRPCLKNKHFERGEKRRRWRV